ncbi:hypothetical protein GOP47_0011913 [Adiantum capillus-veneris]|uniref:Glycosyltransferase 61 catalytic domain-containing protein n=1 Tax=Adiantum capillus-veneris TaxID=13818 RepID=A0A9D4ZI48_ADICA|nr:hypothetical protein GOP47_0011913 [Adiantum capillus-veneris]
MYMYSIKAMRVPFTRVESCKLMATIQKSSTHDKKGETEREATYTTMELLLRSFSTKPFVVGKSSRDKLLASSYLLLLTVLLLSSLLLRHGLSPVDQKLKQNSDEASNRTMDEIMLVCDRSSSRTDVCMAKGNVRVVGGEKADNLYEVVVYQYSSNVKEREARVKPYTRKHDKIAMKSIPEVKLLGKALDRQLANNYPACEVRHLVPAILFSTGGYTTGNLFHQFTDGLIPLYLTAQQYQPVGQLVLLVLEYKRWWVLKYAEILSQITSYTIIDLATNKLVHCFPEVTVGLRFDDELYIDPQRHLGAGGASMAGFQAMLRAAYLPRPMITPSNLQAGDGSHSHADARPAPLPIRTSNTIAIKKLPNLVIMSRMGSRDRVLLNEQEVVALAEEIGFAVKVVAPEMNTSMAELYGAVSVCDVMMGVHGAALTHVVFMREGATLIQVVPLGTEWVSEVSFGKPARMLGLRYVEYKVSPRESSLWNLYPSYHPVLIDPQSINSKGWNLTSRIYLKGQNVTLSLPNITATLCSVYAALSIYSATPLVDPLNVTTVCAHRS